MSALATSIEATVATFRHANRRTAQRADSVVHTAAEDKEYGARVVEVVLRLRNRYKRRPGETDKLILAEMHRRGFVHLTEDDIDEILDRRMDALEAELAIIDSCDEWKRVERRRVAAERMGGARVA